MPIRLLIFLFTVFAARAAEMQAPEGFTVHDLGSMGGQVLLPNGWFFATGQAPNGPYYTLLKEDSGKGSYDTGMRIQFVAKVKATAGISPKQAVQLNIDRKKAKETVVHECPESQMGAFRRVCLETLGFPSKAKPTQKFHLVYSFWWNDETDLMAAVTFGAPVEEWAEAKKIYDVIKDFKILDLDRVPKKTD